MFSALVLCGTSFSTHESASPSDSSEAEAVVSEKGIKGKIEGRPHSTLRRDADIGEPQPLPPSIVMYKVPDPVPAPAQSPVVSGPELPGWLCVARWGFLCFQEQGGEFFLLFPTCRVPGMRYGHCLENCASYSTGFSLHHLGCPQLPGCQI